MLPRVEVFESVEDARAVNHAARVRMEQVDAGLPTERELAAAFALTSTLPSEIAAIMVQAMRRLIQISHPEIDEMEAEPINDGHGCAVTIIYREVGNALN